MRNVNGIASTVSTTESTSFILTMRNVNEPKNDKFEWHPDSFILTMRNVNEDLTFDDELNYMVLY